MRLNSLNDPNSARPRRPAEEQRADNERHSDHDLKLSHAHPPPAFADHKGATGAPVSVMPASAEATGGEPSGLMSNVPISDPRPCVPDAVTALLSRASGEL